MEKKERRNKWDKFCSQNLKMFSILHAEIVPYWQVWGETANNWTNCFIFYLLWIRYLVEMYCFILIPFPEYKLGIVGPASVTSKDTSCNSFSLWYCRICYFSGTPSSYDSVHTVCYFSDAFCSVEFITFQICLAQTSGYVSVEFI